MFHTKQVEANNNAKQFSNNYHWIWYEDHSVWGMIEKVFTSLLILHHCSHQNTANTFESKWSLSTGTCCVKWVCVLGWKGNGIAFGVKAFLLAFAVSSTDMRRETDGYSLMERKEYFFSRARRSGSEGAGSGWMLSGRAMLRLQMGVCGGSPRPTWNTGGLSRLMNESFFHQPSWGQTERQV